MLPPLRLTDTLRHRTHGPGKNNSVTMSSETGEVCTLHLQTDDSTVRCDLSVLHCSCTLNVSKKKIISLFVRMSRGQ